MTEPVTVELAVPPEHIKETDMWIDNFRKWARMSAEDKPPMKTERVRVSLEVYYRGAQPTIDTNDLQPGVRGWMDAGLIPEDCVVEFDPDIKYIRKNSFHRHIGCRITAVE